MIATITYPDGQRSTCATGSQLMASPLVVLEQAITPESVDGRVARRFIERLAFAHDGTIHELVLSADATSVIEQVVEPLEVALLKRRCLLLLPWGLRREQMRSLVETASDALQAATSQKVQHTHLARPVLPHVRGALVEIEQSSTSGQQIEPFVQLYPGWPPTYCCLMAADARVVVLASTDLMPEVADRSSLQKREMARLALVHALYPEEVSNGWSLPASCQPVRDGEIYANYLVDMVRAVLFAAL